MTTGVLDAAHLAQALRKVLIDKAPDAVLDEYAKTRRDVFNKQTDALSTANLLRLRSSAPADVAERENFFKALEDPTDIKGIVEVLSMEMRLSTTLDPIEVKP